MHHGEYAGERMRARAGNGTDDLLASRTDYRSDEIWQGKSSVKADRVGEKPLRIALAGNPNCGKTTLFNALTGSRLRTANWSGVTVGLSVGLCRVADAEIVDLPGLYSVKSASAEEEISRRVLSDLAEAGVGGVINIADATALSRSLVLTLSMIGMGIPLTLALNMTDVLEASGSRVDAGKLSEILGIPVVPICARRRDGLRELMNLATAKTEPGAACRNTAAGHCTIRTGRGNTGEKIPDPDALRRMSENDLARLAENIAAQCVSGGARASLSDKLDGVLCHPFFGTVAFLAIMAAVFALTFILGDLVRALPDSLVGLVGDGARRAMEGAGAAAWLVSLVCDGIVPGVGAVVSFVPELFILFMCLAVLEDSGYMARAAWVAHPFMRHLGLSGKAALPMILGFGCTVPAVLSTRMIDGKASRRRLTKSLPFIPCTARLPVCVMLADMFFGSCRIIAVSAMYLLAVASAAATAGICRLHDGKTGGKGRSIRQKRDLGISPGENVGKEGNGDGFVLCNCIKSSNDPASPRKFGSCINCRGCTSGEATDEPFVMEMPDYRSPGAWNVLRIALGRVGEFLRRAGSVILFASVLVWALVNLSPDGLCASSESIGASLGRTVAPIFRPVGLGYWQIILSLICALGAKELALSSLTVIFGTSSPAALRLCLNGIGFYPPNALSFIAFVMLYVPCASTLAVIRSEQGTRVMLGCAVRCLAVSYAVSAAVYAAACAILG